MKDKLLLFLLLLSVQTTQVCSVPYPPDANRKCLNMTTEYLNESFNLCCKRCPPGHRQEHECNETDETKCKPCETGRYLATWNFTPNCFSCRKCKPTKGLQIAQACTITTNAECVCKPGKYCAFMSDDSQCSDCTDYTRCKPGYGVTKPGTPDSDVKCEACPSGTFSNESSYTEPCRSPSETLDTTPIITTSPAAENSDLTVPDTSTPSPSEGFIAPTVGLSLSLENRVRVAIIAGVTGLLGFLIIVMLLLCLYKKLWRKVFEDSGKSYPKVDANGNCETTDEAGQNYLKDSKLTSDTLTSLDHQCLLEEGGASSDQSQCSITSENLPKAYKDYTSQKFISPLQSTSALSSSTSALSEPMTLLSNTEPVSPQANIPLQCSSQPTSPQIVSPVTNSPHVNVNITLHIGNGSCGSPSVKSTDLSQAEYKLPFGQEEESFSTPQQEAGDLSKTSIVESVYSNT